MNQHQEDDERTKQIMELSETLPEVDIVLSALSSRALGDIEEMFTLMQALIRSIGYIVVFESGTNKKALEQAKIIFNDLYDETIDDALKALKNISSVH